MNVLHSSLIQSLPIKLIIFMVIRYVKHYNVLQWLDILKLYYNKLHTINYG